VSASFDRVSRITAGSLGIAGLVLGGLAYSSFSAQAPYYPAWWYTLALVIHLGLPSILGLLSFAAPLRLIRAVAAAAAIGQLAVLVSLIPVLNWQATPPEAGSPWMLANTALAAASAALAWGGHGRRRERLVWALIISLNVVAVPVRAIGSGMWLELSLMDALVGLCFCAVFGALVLFVLRSARSLDKAASEAAAVAASLAATQAQLRERTLFDALLHDGILSTLLNAGTTGGGAGTAVSAQAASTLSTLRLDPTTPSAPPLTAADVVVLMRMTTAAADPDAEFSHVIDEHRPIPRAAADALAEALTEALRNSLRHAKTSDGSAADRAVHVTVRGSGIDVIELDNGQGFDAAAVPAARMGVSVSIVGRLESIPGGSATIRSGATGTVVTMGWREV
jgi:signal transduction histidine kinase